MDMSLLSQEPPKTPEGVYRVLLEEYERKEQPNERNSNTLIRYIAEPTNIEHLKRLIGGINNLDFRDYVLDRFHNCSRDLNKLSKLADVLEQEAQKIRKYSIDVGIASFEAGAAVTTGALAAMAAAAPGSTTAVVAAKATFIGLDVMGFGGIATATGIATSWFVVKYKKEKLDLREAKENASRILSKLNTLR